jgi:hypothetical protein
MWHKKLLFYIGLGLLMTSCKKDIRAYYFPLTALSNEPKVYEYAYKMPDTTFNIYWYYQTVVKGDSIFLVGQGYNSDFLPTQLLKEERVENGMKMLELSFYALDTEGVTIKLPSRIEYGAVFPFAVKDSNGVFVNIIHYKDPKDSSIETTLTRNRRFLKKTNYTFKNQNVEAVEFLMREEQAEKNPYKGGFSHIFNINEIYAKDIGLVYSKRQITDSVSVECRLIDIYPMANFEEKFKKHLKQ